MPWKWNKYSTKLLKMVNICIFLQNRDFLRIALFWHFSISVTPHRCKSYQTLPNLTPPNFKHVFFRWIRRDSRKEFRKKIFFQILRSLLWTAFSQILPFSKKTRKIWIFQKLKILTKIPSENPSVLLIYSLCKNFRSVGKTVLA